jgi:hypothetical protein
MKKLIILLALISAVFPLLSWDWVSRAGGSQLDWPWSICADNQNNCYLTGSFQGEAGFGNTYLISASSVSDLFISKLDSNGNFDWTLQGFSSGGAVGLSIGQTGNNVYVTGYFVDSLYIDGHTLTGNGVWDVFLIKCTLDGQVQSAISFGSSLSEIGYGLACNSSSVFLTGWYNGNMNVSGQTVNTSGGSDIFVIQYDHDLNLQNITTGNGPGVNYGYEIDCNINKTFTVGSSGGHLIINNTEVDSTSGSYVYIKDINSNTQSYSVMHQAGVMNVKADEDNNVYVVGSFAGQAVFGPHVIYSQNNSSDFFCAKLNSNLEWEWVKNFGSNDIDKGKDIAIFGNKIYIVCNFNDTLNIANNTYISLGNENIVIIQLDSDGNIVKTSTAGGNATTIASGLCTSPDGTVFVTGWFSGLSTFGQNSVQSSSDFDLDIYISKYSSPIPISESIQTDKPSFSVYPNPVLLSENSTVNLEINKNFKNDLKVTVFNVKGQKLMERTLDHFNKALNLENKIDHSGIYFIKVDDSASSYTKKILVLK